MKKSVEFPCFHQLAHRFLMFFVRFLDIYFEHDLFMSSDTENRVG